MSRTSRATKSRWPSVPVNGQPARVLPADHPAIIGGRTLYPTQVRQPSRDGAAHWALKGAENSRKIGGRILKGRWKGIPGLHPHAGRARHLSGVLSPLAKLLRE